MKEKSLLSIDVGKEAIINKLKNKQEIRRRLFDLGIIPGVRVKCLYEAPSGNPKAYLVRGTVIALRNRDAEMVIVGTNDI